MSAAPSRLRRRAAPAALARALRFAYWAARRAPRVLPHMAAALAGALVGAARLRLGRRPVVAIALIEHMGDIVAAEPLARLARAAHPGARLVWIARPPYRALAAACPAVDAVVTVRCLTEWMLLWRLARFATVWDLHPNLRQCPHCCVPLEKTAAGAAALPDQDSFLRFGSLLAMQCAAAGLLARPEAPHLAPLLAPPPAAARTIDRLGLPARYVAIHCRSSDPRKDWREVHWRALVAEILAGWDGAVVEVGLEQVALGADGPRTRGLCGKLSMLESAEAIRRARLFVGIDSGPAHLANAVGTPGVVLLGGLAGVARYVPFSGGYAEGRATLLHAEGPAAALPVEAVARAVLARLG